MQVNQGSETYALVKLQTLTIVPLFIPTGHWDAILAGSTVVRYFKLQIAHQKSIEKMYLAKAEFHTYIHRHQIYSSRVNQSKQTP